MAPDDQFNARVIITRPKSQSNRLAQLVEESGGVAIRIPALEIRMAEHPDIVHTFFDRLSDYHILIFISPNAVTYSQAYFDVADVADISCLAVGGSTAQVMEQAGITCEAYPQNYFTSEAMLELPLLADVSKKNILIVRGNGGRALLGNELTNRGANVDYAEVYQRQIPVASSAGLNAVLREQAADLVIANSVETLSNIVSMTDEHLLDALQSLQLVTGSSRVVQAAVENGFKKPALLAGGPDDNALMQAILDWSKYSARAASENSESVDPGANRADDVVERLAQTAPSEHNNATDTAQTNEDQTDSEHAGAVNEDRAQFELSEPIADKPNTNDRTNVMPNEDTMTDQQANHSDLPSEEQPNSSKTSDDAVDLTTPPPPKQKRSGAGIAWLALLTALLAGGGAAWTWWQAQNVVAPEVVEIDVPTRDEIAAQIRQEIEQQSNRIRNTVSQQTDQIESALDKQSEFASSLRTQKRSVENLTDQLSGMENSISAMRGVSANVRNTWVRAETEYFLQTANTRLQLAGDVNSAIQALKAADERMVALGDPSLTPVRAQLSEDLLALESLPRLDIEGIALAINALSERADNLQLLNASPDNYIEVSQGEKNASDEEAGAWQRTKNAFTGALGNVVRFSPTDENAAAILAPNQVYFLYRNLQLQLQAARIAALQGQQSTFDDSLSTSIEWLEQYFDDTDNNVVTMLNRLRDLQKQKVAHELPDISASLNMVRAKLATSRSSTPTAPPANDAGNNQAPKLAP